jgi:dihydroorotate dehydrogenase electron transfer subunit
MIDKKIKIKEIRDLGAGNYFFTLNTPEQARLVQPGQFVMLKCAANLEENPLLRRPFSIFDIHRNPRTGRPAGLDLLVKDVGVGTHKLVQLKPGAEVFTLGPQGRPFQLSPETTSRFSMACVVAGGVGIAALHLLTQRLLSQMVTPILFYGGRNVADLVLREHFERLGIRTFYATEDGSCGERGVVTQPLERFLHERARADVMIFACGPWGMMRATHQLASRYHLPCQVSLEARMGCSLGACMGCVIHGWDDKGEEQYLRVCLEGPVMKSRLVDWEMAPI